MRKLLRSLVESCAVLALALGTVLLHPFPLRGAGYAAVSRDGQRLYSRYNCRGQLEAANDSVRESYYIHARIVKVLFFENTNDFPAIHL